MNMLPYHCLCLLGTLSATEDEKNLAEDLHLFLYSYMYRVPSMKLPISSFLDIRLQILEVHLQRRLLVNRHPKLC